MYNMKMVSKMVGIPSVTLRAWERRYAVLTPGRSESGHRLYSDEDIEDLLWLKKQTEELGMTHAGRSTGFCCSGSGPGNAGSGSDGSLGAMLGAAILRPDVL